MSDRNVLQVLFDIWCLPCFGSTKNITLHHFLSLNLAQTVRSFVSAIDLKSNRSSFHGKQTESA